MSRRICSLLLIAAAGAALVAGCGGSGNSSATTTATTTSSAASTHSGAATTQTQTSSTPTATIPSQGSAAGAVTAYCKSVLSVAQAHLTSAQVNEFKQYCAALSHENATQIKTSVKELCTTILRGSLPASERSLAAAECAKF